MTGKLVYCHCGRELHYSDPVIEAQVHELVQHFGVFINVTVGSRTWRVNRHYIALHGLKAEELPDLGFMEVTE